MPRSIITKFSVYSHCNDLGGKVWNPAIKWTQKYAVFVVLECDSGECGLGECWCFDSAPDTLVSFLRTEIAPHILGMQLDEFDAQYQRLIGRATLTARHGILASALSGVDIAIWDVRSRAAGVPLWVYLQNCVSTFIPAKENQARLSQVSIRKNQAETSRVSSRINHAASLHGCVYLYGSGGLYGQDKGVDDLVAEMSGMIEFGFDIVKMKVGGLSLSEDVARVRAVLEEIDDGCKLIIDGVYSYTVDEALTLYRQLPAHRIEAFQSPVKASDLAGMQALIQSGVPVMGTEAEYREEIHEQIMQRGAVSFLQTAPVACGGITRLIELSALQSAHDNTGVQFSLEVSSTAIALFSACHFAAASNWVAHTEYHFIHQVFFDDMNLENVPGQPGWFKLPHQPGLGITLPLSSVQLACSVTV